MNPPSVSADRGRKRLLIVSPHFPPVNAPDMQRVRQCLPHLAATGWDAEVLTVDPRDVAMPQDPLLLEGLPPSTPVHRVRAWPLALGRLVGVGSLAARARSALGRRGDALLAQRRFDLVFFSTTQFSVMTLGPRWRKKFGVPYAVDWQDPWVTDYYGRPGAPRPPGGWKYRVAAGQARRLEPRVLRQAAGLVCTSSDYIAQLQSRYSGFAIPSAVIPFGAEPDDFRVAARPGVSAAFERRPGVRHLVYVGAAGPIMRPALELLFAGVRSWLEAHPAGRSALKLHFIGTSYAPSGRQEPSVLPIAAAAGLGDIVEERTSRVSHFSALKTMLEADALLLLGSTDEGYSPSKLATLTLAGKPVLALIPGGGQLESQLKDLGIGCPARFSPSLEPDRVRQFLESMPGAAPTATARLTARARTTELLEFFGRIL